MKKFLASILATTMILEMGAVPVAMAMDTENTALVKSSYQEGDFNDLETIETGEIFTSTLSETEEVAPISDFGTVSGTCGENLTWTLVESTGVLTISGTGEMDDYLSWYDYRGNITSVVIGESVQSICDYAFFNCISLSSVTIPNSVTSIGSYAFGSCTSLSTATIGASVSSISSTLFSNCTSLSSITVDATNQYYTSENGCLFSKDKTTLMKHPIGKSGTSYTIPNSVTSIGYEAFRSCTNLSAVTIPNSVTTIGSSAFSGCTSLEEMTIPDSVTSIGQSAFSVCTNLSSITIPGSVGSTGRYAFSGCTSLSSVTILDSVQSIGDYAFYKCSSLKSITIPGSLKYIGVSAFSNCGNISDVYYGGGESQWDDISITAWGNSDLTSATIHYYSTGPADTEDEDQIIGDLNLSSGTIPANHYAVCVLSYDKTALEGATVKIGSDTYTTDENGLVIVPTSGGEPTATISHKNYITREMTLENTSSMSKNIVMLFTEDVTMVPVTVKANYGGKESNLLSTPYYLKELNETAPSTSKTFTIAVETFAINEIVKYELIQGTNVIASSSTNTLSFDAITFGTNNVFGTSSVAIGIKNVTAENTIYLKMTDSEGNTEKTPLSFMISPKESYSTEMPATGFDFSWGGSKGSTITIPSSDTTFGKIFGGTEFGLNLPDELAIPMTIESFADGSMKFSINLTELADEPVDWEKIEKDWAQALKDKDNPQRLYGKTDDLGNPVKVWSYDADIDFVLYGEGILDTNYLGNLSEWEYDLDYGLLLKGELSAKTLKYFPVTVLFYTGPAYTSFKFAISPFAEGNGKLVREDGEFRIDFHDDVGISGSITGTGGLGVHEFIDASVSATGTLTGTNRILDDYQKITANMKILTEANLTILNFEKEWLDYTWTLYDSSNPFSASYNLSRMNFDQFTNSSSYTMMDRNYLTAVAPRTINPVGTSTVKSQVFYNPTQQLVSVNDVGYLFWIDDAGVTRTDENRTALFYAYETGDGWTEPVQVISETADSTNDFNFDLTVVDDKIHVAMLKNENQLSGELTVESIYSDCKIVYATVDTSADTVSELTSLGKTTEETPVMMPKISEDGSLIAWIENDADSEAGLLGVGNTNRIRYVNTSNLNEVKTVEVAHTILSLAISSGEIAYIIDSDDDFNTSEDKAVCVYDISSNSTTTVHTGANSVLTCVDSVLYWYSGNNIAYSSDNTTITMMFEENSAIMPSKNLHISKNGENLAIAWHDLSEDSEYTEDNSGFSASLYGAHYENGAWSDAYVLQNISGDSVSSVSSYLDDDNFVVAWRDRTEDSVSLKVTSTNKPANLKLHWASVEETTESEIPLVLTIENTGATVVNTIDVMIDGVKIETIENANLAQGTIGEFEVNYAIPSDLKSAKDVTVSISTDGELITTDNEKSILVGTSDLVLDVERTYLTGSEAAMVTVHNNSAFASGGTLEIRSHNEDGKVIYSKNFDEVSGGAGELFLINLSALENDENQRIDSFYFTVTSNNQDYNEINNATFLYLGVGREVVETFTITLDAQGGTVSKTEMTTGFDGKLSALPEPTKVNYEFDGWFTEKSGGTQVTTDTTFTKNMTIYAQWVEIDDENDGNDDNLDNTVEIITNSIDYVGGSAKVNYSFKGDIAEHGVSVGTTKESVENRTSKTLNVDIPHNSNGVWGTGTIDFSILLNYFTDETETLYVMMYAMDTEGNYVNGNVLTLNRSDDTPLEPSTCIITFNPNSGTFPHLSTTIYENQPISSDFFDGSYPDPQRAGYIFKGWYTASTGGTKITESTVFSSNTTIYAQWTAIESDIVTYTVTFDANGGELDLETMETGSDFKLSSLPTPTLEGYIFDGWFTTKSGSTQVTTDYEFTKDRTIYAQWSKPTYTIKFDAQSGIDKAVYITTDEDGYIDEFPTPTHETLFFDGWYLTQNGGTESVTKDTVFTENTFLYARWKDATSYFGTYKNMISAKNTKGSNYGGTVSTDNSNPMEGETVTLTVSTTLRYSLLSISAENSKGVTVSLKKISDDKYTFVQPADNLEITAIFEFQSG